jgi:uncharacterized membrane protein
MKKINWHDPKLWAGLTSLAIVLVQQVMKIFGFEFPEGLQGQIIDAVNTLLTILGMLGVVSDVHVNKGGKHVKTK